MQCNATRRFDQQGWLTTYAWALWAWNRARLGRQALVRLLCLDLRKHALFDYYRVN